MLEGEIRGLHQRNAHLVLIRVRRVNHVENLPVQLNHGLRESVQENALHRTDFLVVVGVVLQIGVAEGERAVERMLVVIRASAVDFLVVGGIHVDLAGSSEQDMRIGGHRFNDRADAVWWVIIVVIHDDNDIARCLLGEVVELFAHRDLRFAVGVVESLFTEVYEQVFDGLRAVIKDEPLHEVMVVVLLLVDLDEAGNEAAPVVGRCDDGDEHWCFVWAALAVQILIGLKINRQVEQ